jgi:hypothetical protein
MNSQARRKKRRERSNKGGRPSWTTPEQAAWLHERLPAHNEAQTKGRKFLDDFWKPIWEAWFEKWPEPAQQPGDDLDPVKQKKKVSRSSTL